MNNETENYGLIFRDDEDNIWMGMYENATITSFFPLSDFDNVYGDLALEKFAFVGVQESENEQVWINDINTFEVGKQPNYEKNEVEAIQVETMLAEMKFPSKESDSMFKSFLAEVGKTN